MQDQRKTKAQLIAELQALRQRLAALESADNQPAAQDSTLNQWQTIIDNLPDQIYAKDKEGRFIVANAALTQEMELSSPQALIGKSDFDFYSSEWAEKWAAEEQVIIKSGQAQIDDEYLTDDAGNVKWNLSTKAPLRDKQGNTIGIVGIRRDITQRKQAEEAVQQSEAQLRTLIEHAPEAIVVYDVDQRCPVIVNQGAERLFGLDREALLTRSGEAVSPVTQANGRLSLEFGQEKIEEALHGGRPVFEWRYLDATGQTIPCEVRLVRIPSTGRRLLRVSMIDVSERKDKEAALRQYADRLQILHEMDQAILAAQSPESIAHAALSHLRKLVQCQRAEVSLYDLKAQQAVILSVDAEGETGLPKGKRYSLKRYAKIIEAAQLGEVVIIEEREKPRITPEVLFAEEIFASAYVPLLTQGQLIGILALGAGSIEVLQQMQMELVQSVADQLAIAIQQTRLQEQVQDYASGLERRVADRTRELAALYDVTAVASKSLDLMPMLDDVLGRVLAAMQSQAGTIHTLDDSGETLHLLVQHALPPEVEAALQTLSLAGSLVGWIIQRAEPLIVPDLHHESRTLQLDYGHLRSYLGVPIRSQGQVLGVLSVARDKEQAGFIVEEVALLTSIADQVGVIIESARLRQAAETAAVMEERARLARDLHDSVTQLLYSVTLFAQAGQVAYRLGNHKQVEAALNELSEISQQALKEMRLLVYELRPFALERDGLVGALQHRLGTVEERAGVKSQLSVDQTMALPGRLEETIYHITIEALNNALKHAAATEVSVRIIPDDNQVLLEVTDNGVGFDAETKSGGGIGLSSMRERAEKLSGHLTIQSASDKGTTIQAVLPI